MNPFLQRARRGLQTLTLKTFSGLDYVWWKNGAVYVKIATAATQMKVASDALTGLIRMPTDAMSFHCTASDFTSSPRAEMIFLFGPDDEGEPSDTCKRYRVLSVESYGEHLTIIGERHV